MQVHALTEREVARSEARQQRYRLMKMALGGAIGQLRKQAEAGLTEPCEAAATELFEILRHPNLPRDFAEESRVNVDAAMREAFMKATSVAAQAAIEAARNDDLETRRRMISEAREKLSGAMRYNAPETFERKCEQMLETALFSGGVKAKGPTKAKPLDTAPKAPSRAKFYDA